MKDCQTSYPRGEIPNMLSFSHQSCLRIWAIQYSDEKQRNHLCVKLAFIYVIC